MEERKLESKIFRVYRDMQNFSSNEHQLLFMTDPFLVDVGCGGCGTRDSLIEKAHTAQKADYRIVLINGHTPGSEYYPLHSDDYQFLNKRLNLRSEPTRKT